MSQLEFAVRHQVLVQQYVKTSCKNGSREKRRRNMIDLRYPSGNVRAINSNRITITIILMTQKEDSMTTAAVGCISSNTRNGWWMRGRREKA